MPALLLSLVARWGVPKPLQRLAAYGLMAVAFFVICGLVWFALHEFWRSHDKRVVSDYQNKVAAHDAPIVRKADENADQSRANDQQHIQQDQSNEQQAIDAQPSNGLTPMQRARACSIIVRQARDLGKPRPAGC